uniref:E3 ubiquitin-protein ligase n=1 Tax=Megaselia scalaris TaxID=36166 RepID=T1GD96_MEGSC
MRSFFYEVLAGIWVRNGLQIKGQAMTYIQANFCNSMVDMDIFFLQICATQLPPGIFLQTG